MSSTPTLVSVNASGLSLCRLRTYLWPSLLQPYPAHMLRVALCPASLPHPSQPAPPSCLGCPSAAAPRTLEQQGTLVRGHLSQSADEEAEAQGGKAPCPRLHSELVSEPAQGPASVATAIHPDPLPTSAAFSPCLAPPHPAGFPSVPGPAPCCSNTLPACASAGCPSPAPVRRAQSSLCLRDETLAGGQRRKLSSRFPVGRSSESFSPGDTPRQRFRQRRPGPLGALNSHGKGEGQGSLPPIAPTPYGPTNSLVGGASLLSPVSPHKPCRSLHWSLWPSRLLVPPPGPGVGWDGSVETLAEHETDVNREGESGYLPYPGR